MRNLNRLIVALLLLIAPVTAYAAAPVTTAPQPAIQISTKGQATLDTLEAAAKTRDEAREAHLADAANADLEAGFTEAKTAYETALEAARAERDATGDNGSELGIAIYDISADSADASAAGLANMVTKWTTQGKDWLVDNGPGVIVKLVLFIAILLVFKFLAGLAASLTGKGLSTSKLKVSDLLKKFFVGIVRKVIFFVGLIIALGQVGVDTGPLLAGIGVVGFVIGFALQDTLSNFAAGIMILLYRPYDVGDVITAGGETGKVEDMSLVSTTMLTPDNQKLIIPNSSIWGGTIRNITAQATRRVDMTIGVGYGDDLDRAQEVLMEVVSAHEKVLNDPAPVVKVTNLGESSVDFAVRPWSKTGDYWDVYWDLTKTIKQRLDAEGISIPFPQRDLHLVAVPEKMAISS